MPIVTVPLNGVDREYLTQLEYALSFASQDIVECHVNNDASMVEAEIQSEAARDSATQKIAELIRRYSQREFGTVQHVFFEQDRKLPVVDAWSGLLQRKWATPVGQGHVILRGLAAELLEFIDHKIANEFARHFDAELEIYPSTIRSETLQRCHHFTSFPEHVDFVAHLKPDLSVLNQFAAKCRVPGWTADLHEGHMAANDFAISPSCCYHCYEGMENWQLDGPRCTTMSLACHRYEGARHATLSRLRAFTMREVVFIGDPKFVIASRRKAEDLIVEWAKDWELACRLETANDMFFTEDFAVKASFQRLQEAKHELRLQIPTDNSSLAVFSSNFHALTFGKAFNITFGGRPATTGCVGWGLERWVYALFSQFGFDMSCWPGRIQEEFAAYQKRKNGSR